MSDPTALDGSPHGSMNRSGRWMPNPRAAPETLAVVVTTYPMNPATSPRSAA